MKVKQYNYVTEFTCLQNKCPDTCCFGWSMVVDQKTKELYQNEAKELLDVLDKENDLTILKRKEDSFCSKLENGLCKIHKDYGEKFLGDACYFYPRVTYKVGEEIIMTAGLSCPVIANNLLKANELNYDYKLLERIPNNIKDYKPDNLAVKEVWEIHQAFLRLIDKGDNINITLARIYDIAKSLDNIDNIHWEYGINILIDTVDARINKPSKDNTNYHKLLCALVILTKSIISKNPKFINILENIAYSLGVTINWQECSIISYKDNDGLGVDDIWKDIVSKHNYIFKNYFKAEFIQYFFPFGIKDKKVTEKVSKLIFKFSAIKLGLACTLKENYQGEDIIHIIQVMSRFLDHMPNNDLLYMIFEDFNWSSDTGILSLVY